MPELYELRGNLDSGPHLELADRLVRRDGDADQSDRTADKRCDEFDVHELLSCPFRGVGGGSPLRSEILVARGYSASPGWGETCRLPGRACRREPPNAANRRWPLRPRSG
jgi:hypothetical protein